VLDIDVNKHSALTLYYGTEPDKTTRQLTHKMKATYTYVII